MAFLDEKIKYLTPLLIIPLIIVLPFVLIASFYLGFKQFFFSFLKGGHPSTKHDFVHSPGPNNNISHIVLNAFQTCLKVILFPFYISFIGLQTLLMMLIYPMSLVSKENFSSSSFGYTQQLSIIGLNIFLRNGIQLYTIELQPKSLNETNPHVIFFGGNGATFRDYKETMVYLAKSGITVIAFDSRGFGKSGKRLNNIVQSILPKSTQELVEEGIAQVERLKQKGVPANKITLYGHSLGGGISALVAAHFHKKGFPIKVINDRSFSSISAVVKEWLSLDNEYEKKSAYLSWGETIQRGTVWFLYGLVKGILWLTDCEIDAAKAYSSIPSTCRTHFVVRDVKEVNEEGRKILDVVDFMIPYRASMHRDPLVEEERKRSNVERNVEPGRKLIFNRFPPSPFCDMGCDVENRHMCNLAFFRANNDPSNEPVLKTMVKFIQR